MQDIIIASDHRGFALKAQIKEFLKTQKLFFVDVGTNAPEPPVDFPKYVREACDCITSAKHFCGILICGSGIGVTMSANRFRGIRAVLAYTPEIAKSARQHNDANVVCLGADGADFENVKKIITTFLNTKFLGDEKYIRRNKMLDN